MDAAGGRGRPCGDINVEVNDYSEIIDALTVADSTDLKKPAEEVPAEQTIETYPERTMHNVDFRDTVAKHDMVHGGSFQYRASLLLADRRYYARKLRKYEEAATETSLAEDVRDIDEVL